VDRDAQGVERLAQRLQSPKQRRRAAAFGLVERAEPAA
jgi:hypothetical protein